MSRYRVGRSWGVTIVEERDGQPDRLVGTMQRPEDAELVVKALNAAIAAAMDDEPTGQETA